MPTDTMIDNDTVLDADDDECQRARVERTETGLVHYAIVDPRKRAAILARLKSGPRRASDIHPSSLWKRSPFPPGCGPHDWMAGVPGFADDGFIPL